MRMRLFNLNQSYVNWESHGRALPILVIFPVFMISSISFRLFPYHYMTEWEDIFIYIKGSVVNGAIRLFQ